MEILRKAWEHTQARLNTVLIENSGHFEHPLQLLTHLRDTQLNAVIHCRKALLLFL